MAWSCAFDRTTSAISTTHFLYGDHCMVQYLPFQCPKPLRMDCHFAQCVVQERLICVCLEWCACAFSGPMHAAWLRAKGSLSAYSQNVLDCNAMNQTLQSGHLQSRAARHALVGCSSPIVFLRRLASLGIRRHRSSVLVGRHCSL